MMALTAQAASEVTEANVKCLQVTTTDGAKTATCTVTVAATTYTVTVKEGTEDASSWTITPSTAAEGETVNIEYTGSHDYQVTPVNLGWVATGGDGKQGYNPYYQWGRKDAFIPGTWNSTTNHTVYDINDGTVTNAITYSTTSVGIADNIKNPTTFYNVSSKPNSTTFYNLWDALQTGTGNITTATKKTVYDPCPAGFCVPTGNLYYYMADNNGRGDNNWDSTTLVLLIDSP